MGQFSNPVATHPRTNEVEVPPRDFKTGTNEAYNIKIKIRVGGILKILCFCLYANMAASDKGISLKRKILEKDFT